MAQDRDALPDDDVASPDDAKEREALREWSRGNRRAGNWLTTRYFPRIQAYFKRRAPEEYEDLVAKTFEELTGSAAKYRGEGTVQIFIYSIARNVLRQHWRRRRCAPAMDPYSTTLGDLYGKRPSEKLVQREERKILDDSLRAISLADLDLLELRYWQGLTGPELRELLDIPEGTVRSRLRAALGRLRARYDEASATPGRELPENELELWIEQLRSKPA